jgi:hypothetical protein
MIRDALMLVYGTAWLAVVIITAVRTGVVPAELWAVLGVGEGALLAIFKADESRAVTRRTRNRPKPRHDKEVSS